MADKRQNSSQNQKRQAAKRPANAGAREGRRDDRQPPRRKKKTASPRAHSAAAVLGALFAIVFVGVVGIMMFKIRIAVDDRDRKSTVTVEPYKAPDISAVTETSSAAETAAVPADTQETAVTTTVDPLVVIPDQSSTADNKTTVVADPKKPTANSITDLSGLRNDLTALTENFGGKWQIYVRHMDSNTELTIESSELYSSGLIDLFAAASAYQQVTEGKLDAAYAEDLIRAMIAMNDTGALEELSEKQGLTATTDWCRQQGFWDTELKYESSVPGNSDESADSSDESGDDSEEEQDNALVQPVITLKKNTTSARDVGRLLTAIYKGEIVSKDYCDKIIGFMQSQTDKNKIAVGLPEDIRCANKAGTTDDAVADAAVVYCDTGDYVLVVMGDTPGFGWTADNDFAQISETVYNYFNGEPKKAGEKNDTESRDPYDDEEDEEEDEYYGEPTGITE